MNTAVVNIKIDEKTKKEAQKIALELGVSLSSIIKSYLRQLVRTKKVILSAEEPTQFTLNALKESKEDIKAGRISPSFDNVIDAIKWLNKPLKKNAN